MPAGAGNVSVCSLKPDGSAIGDSKYSDLLKIDIDEDKVKYGIRDIKITSYKLKKIFSYSSASTSSTTPVYSALRLSGISIKTDFECENSAEELVTYYSQNDYGDRNNDSHRYGGKRLDDGTIIGRHRTISRYGCVLTTCSMLLTYYGYQVTPLELNEWLQDPPETVRGYNWFDAGASISSWDDRNANGLIDVGETISFSHDFETKDIGEEPVIRDGTGIPVGTAIITSPRNGEVRRILGNQAIHINNVLGWYDDLVWTEAVQYSRYHDSTLGLRRIKILRRVLNAEPIEDSFAKGYPVPLRVHGDGHTLLGVGIMPDWDIDPIFKTYKIYDPVKANAPEERNYLSRLTTTFNPRSGGTRSYNNTFDRGELIVPVSGTWASDDYEPYFRVCIYSPVEICVTDSSGRRTGVDLASLEPVSEIPNSSYTIEVIAQLPPIFKH